MKTTAVRIYGKNDLRLESFELPEINDSEILARVISDSICMSSYKAAIQGGDHKRVPNDVAQNPTIIGHEFCGEIVSVGKRWSGNFNPGDKFAIQPAINYNGSLDSPGYSFKYVGGDATYVVIPSCVMEMDCLLKYNGKAFFYGSLSEPMSCVIGAFHASYHTKQGSYVHDMGIADGGKLALLAAAGPMGLAAIAYAVYAPRHASIVVVTDIDGVKLARAASIITPEAAAKNGVKLYYVNTADIDARTELLKYTDGKGYDDVFVFAPVKPVVELGDSLLGHDGCLNFFAGPSKSDFSALFNFYNVHYGATHIVGTTGGNTSDMCEAISLMENGVIDPSFMITHIGGLNCVVETTLNLPHIPGGKKLIYTGIKLPLTAVDDFGKLGKNDPMFAHLAELTAANNGMWSSDAERYLLENAPRRKDE